MAVKRSRKPDPPTSLGRAGRALWRAIQADLPEGWELDRREAHHLREACAIEDQLAALGRVLRREGMVSGGSAGQRVVHPAVQETRQLRLAQARLLGMLGSPDAEAQPAQLRGLRGRAA